ncbi:hypothetical protein KBX50_05070 [Micromonospora sp. C51]|uniref:hypothetical protein n=1 Tax=Micromonospora sp. C51 TaxID=2824879 RepID=UPI001B3639A5|nr:hypothetical protein [Micromonospora sp. C51]MBQ1047829.1 hypothetical protein [Micromonospora sp. C51]
MSVEQYGGVPDGDTALAWVDDPDDEDLWRSVRSLIHCQTCGHLLVDVNAADRSRGDYADRCPTGQCTSYRCVNCHAEWGSVGPVDCRSCGSARLTRRDRRIRALRAAYRARKRRRRRSRRRR